MLKCQAIDLGSSIPAGAYGGCRIHGLALAVFNNGVDLFFLVVVFVLSGNRTTIGQTCRCAKIFVWFVLIFSDWTW